MVQGWRGSCGQPAEDAEEICDELLRSIYGVWDHLKNGGDHGAQNLDLGWVGIVPGYRESRRLEGDYLLNENDVWANRLFPDAVAYGGWAMDEHTPGGLRDLDKLPSRILNFSGIYTIPYRCYYSRNVDNLMMAGRDISASKMAFGTTRLMGTCSIGRQAVGTAAAMAVARRPVGRHQRRRGLRPGKRDKRRGPPGGGRGKLLAVPAAGPAGGKHHPVLRRGKKHLPGAPDL